MDKLVRTYLGQYWIVEIIGQGSTSTVYKAYQTALDRYVAVKVLFRHLNPQFTSRFKREAQAVARLQHPNILPIYDFAQQDELYYFVTQYVEGNATLADMLARAPLKPLAALQQTRLILAALNYAHERGIIHRDIKPSNILMPRPDWPLLADFGIARITDDNQRLTPTGHTVGTVAYMAPERATDQPADVRTDLYAVGVVLYEMVTGRVPFDAVTPLAVLMQHVHQPPPPPRTLAPDLPTLVETIILCALEKNPDQRYQSAAEMSDDVQRAIVQLEQAQPVAPALSSVVPAARPPADETRTTRKLPPDDEADDDTTQLIPSASAAPVAPAVPQKIKRPAPAPKNTYFVILALALLLLGAATIVWVNVLPATSARVPITPSAQVPGSAPAAAATDARATQPTRAAATASAEETTAIPQPATRPPTATNTVGQGLYVVQPGDTLSSIATEFSTTVEALLAANGLSDANLIQAGQTLIISTTAQVGQALPTATTQITPASTTRPANGNAVVRLEDTDWQGSYKQQRPYGGRSATWIYGRTTEYSVMQAVFDLVVQPSGTATLNIEGMDSEDSAKTPISISVNGTEIYNGPNPLPNDDYPIDSGTWEAHAFTFDGALLRPGRNEISISNLAEGPVGLPPFFMLDYADLLYSS